MVHTKKILTQYFDDIILNGKRFEIRPEDDCTYHKGDCVVFSEIDGSFHETGKYVVTEITYVLRDIPDFGLKSGYCIFGFELIVSSKL